MGLKSRNLAAPIDIGQMAGSRIQEAMKYGIENDILYGKMLPGRVEQGLYETSLIQNYRFGSHKDTWDGRRFYYAKATNIVASCKFGLKYYGQIGDGFAGTILAINAASGVTVLTITAAGVAVNDLRDGCFMAHVTHQQFRKIVSNTATDSDGRITITLDYATTSSLTTGDWIELLPSGWSNVRLTAGPSGGMSGNDYSSVAGIPNVITTVADTFLWLQTWGEIFVNPHGDSLQDAGIAGGERKVVFDVEGSICIEDDVSHGPGAESDEHQIAGYIMDRSAANTSGPPVIMLTVR